MILPLGKTRSRLAFDVPNFVLVTPEGILLYALRSVWVKLYTPRIAFVNARRQKNTPICKIKIHIDESMALDGCAALPSV